jgi:hypothetical protein
MAYFSDNFVSQRRKQWLRSISAVEVQVGGKWYRGEFDKKEIEDDTLVIMATFPTLNDTACTITASRVLDVRGEVAAYQQRTIEKKAGQGTMIRITIPIYEVIA